MMKNAPKDYGLVWFVWRRYFSGNWDLLHEANLLNDLRQEIYLIALEIEKEVFNKDKEKLSYIQRRLYRFLVNYGFKKPKHSRIYVYPYLPILERDEEEGVIVG